MQTRMNQADLDASGNGMFDPGIDQARATMDWSEGRGMQLKSAEASPEQENDTGAPAVVVAPEGNSAVQSELSTKTSPRKAWESLITRMRKGQKDAKVPAMKGGLSKATAKEKGTQKGAYKFATIPRQLVDKYGREVPRKGTKLGDALLALAGKYLKTVRCAELDSNTACTGHIQSKGFGGNGAYQVICSTCRRTWTWATVKAVGECSLAEVLYGKAEEEGIMVAAGGAAGVNDGTAVPIQATPGGQAKTTKATSIESGGVLADITDLDEDLVEDKNEEKAPEPVVVPPAPVLVQANAKVVKKAATKKNGEQVLVTIPVTEWIQVQEQLAKLQQECLQLAQALDMARGEDPSKGKEKQH